jgi:penicillin-binding protein 1C
MKPKKKILLGGLLLGAILLASLYYSTFGDLPDIHSILDHLNQPSIRITDRNGRLLYEILPEEGGRHAVISFAEIPECLKQATIAIEDHNFYQNPGVDLEGILRALWINIQGGETIAGGSTITQQVARNLLLDESERSQRTLRRKLREALLAWQLAQSLSKDDILALYLNQTYYGGLAYGVQAASQTYFGKPASALLLPECALLAGLPQAPGIYNPYTNPDLARQRELIVLGQMQQQGFVSAAERQQAEDTPLRYNSTPYPIIAPHFVWIVKNQLDRLFESGQLDPRESLVVRTTLDIDDQRLAEAAITRQIKAFKSPINGGLSHNVNNAALVALDPRNGEILALAGSADYFDASIYGAVDMATAPRQPGSAFKPFIYALALDPLRAHPWTAATTILDVSTTFTLNSGVSYTPKNYDGREHGPLPVRETLASSLNIPAVKTLRKVGVENTINLAKKLGISSLDTPEYYDLSLVLGGGQMSLLELSTAYAAFANGGLATGHYAILDIHDADGNIRYTQEKTPQVQVFDPRVAWLINDILSDDRARAIGFGHNSTLKLERAAAVKTGTTTNYHDNWTIGYTPEFLTGVWVGNSNYEAMHDVNGLTGAAPIWNEFMRAALQGHPDRPFTRPDGLIQVEVCDLSGLLPTPTCPRTHREWFIAGTEPTEKDNIYRQVWIDSQTGALADAATPSMRRQHITVLDLPIEAQPWARGLGLPLLADVPHTESDSAPVASDLAFVSPRPNTTYRMTDDIHQFAQQLAVEAIASHRFVQVKIWIDDRLLVTFLKLPYKAWWPLSVGQHTFRVEGITSSGETVKGPSVMISVVAENR